MKTTEKQQLVVIGIRKKGERGFTLRTLGSASQPLPAAGLPKKSA